MKRGPSPRSQSVFLNIPYDHEFEALYRAFIAGLCGFGLVPRTVLEIPGSERRLNRILELIGSCRFSFHDISRVELDRTPPRTPRFNMPFELGLAVAWAAVPKAEHEWFVFEARPHRQQKSLSDLNGTEVYIHSGRPTGVLRALTNALARSKYRPTVAELTRIYRDISREAHRIKRDHATDSLFDTRPFQDLVIAAQLSARERIAGLRHT